MGGRGSAGGGRRWVSWTVSRFSKGGRAHRVEESLLPDVPVRRVGPLLPDPHQRREEKGCGEEKDPEEIPHVEAEEERLISEEGGGGDFPELSASRRS